MCRESGMTAQVMFSGNFAGKIYSSRYGTSHDCVYFNLQDMNMILFDIPTFACGTRLSRGPNGRVARIENEVYVQWDKDAQSVDDKRFLFICDLVENSQSIDGGVLNPSQTVVVQVSLPSFFASKSIGVIIADDPADAGADHARPRRGRRRAGRGGRRHVHPGRLRAIQAPRHSTSEGKALLGLQQTLRPQRRGEGGG